MLRQMKSSKLKQKETADNQAKRDIVSIEQTNIDWQMKIQILTDFITDYNHFINFRHYHIIT